jgi:hypothetical protein
MSKRREQSAARQARRKSKEQPRSHQGPAGIPFWEDDRYQLGLPKKLRGKKVGIVAKMILDELLDVSLDGRDRILGATDFWRDLDLRKIPCPVTETDMLFLLWCGGSELLRAMADYVEALENTSGDRGVRLIASRKLSLYANNVLENGAKKLNWKELKEKFCPYFETDQNWQKFLRDRGIPFDPVGVWHGYKRRCVQNRKKNTHGRRVTNPRSLPLMPDNGREAQKSDGTRGTRGGKRKQSGVAVVDTRARKRS